MSTALQSPHTPDSGVKAYKSLANAVLLERIAAVRREMGSRLLILGHHYQQDEVIALADLRGDSYQLSQMAAANTECRAIAFCGVHFMAETADILANRPERLAARSGERIPVVLPDLAAGCSMADMAAIEQVEAAWREMAEVIDTEDVTPVTYINSAASLKAFCGRHGGIVCTSSNAAAVLAWSFARRRRVLFFPDQHLGRNTAKAMGIALDEMPVWDPHGRRTGRQHGRRSLRTARVLLWKGHCSVHAMFRSEHVDHVSREVPGHSRSWCIPNVRWKWSTRPTSSARPARSSKS